jgi:5-oxoprolinase (ATP-hydrolysing) subunit A
MCGAAAVKHMEAACRPSNLLTIPEACVTVTINCDMGEAFGIYHMGEDEACMPYVTHANIACGFHASDPTVMWRTARAAKREGVMIGSHPGLPDREGFGRREMRLSREEVAALVLYQTGALQAFLAAENIAMSHIKPHGALFGMAQKDEAVANGIADAALALGLQVIAYANCAMSHVFTRRGVPFVCEFYADLDYNDDGRQVITMTHEPIAPERAATKVLRAVREGRTRALSGREVEVVAQSICIHSDTPGALAVAKAVHAALRDYLPGARDGGIRGPCQQDLKDG